MDERRFSSSLSWLSSTCVRFLLMLPGVRGVFTNRGSNVKPLPRGLPRSRQSLTVISHPRQWLRCDHILNQRSESSISDSFLHGFLLFLQLVEKKNWGEFLFLPTQPFSSPVRTLNVTFCVSFSMVTSFWAACSCDARRRQFCSSKTFVSLSTSSVA